MRNFFTQIANSKTLAQDKKQQTMVLIKRINDLTRWSTGVVALYSGARFWHTKDSECLEIAILETIYTCNEQAIKLYWCLI